MTLTWTYTPNPQRPGTEFQIYRCEQVDASPCPMEPYTKTNIGNRSWDNTMALLAGHTYCYEIRAQDAEAQRATSPTVCATMPGLASPLSLTVTPWQ
jgi:hypothetical protein